MKSISILGSTGSVGQSTIKVLQGQAGSYDVQALTANSNAALLAEQAKSLNAKCAVIADEKFYPELKEALANTDIKVAAGQDALLDAAQMPAEWTMASVMGMAGLKPLMASIAQGNIVAIANKEPLVSAGKLVLQAAEQSGATLLPVDSEHNAVFQIYEPDNKNAIERIILTASGGPFRDYTLEEMQNVSPSQALAHPNWVMGRKISIDSATMMNKALEVIEAERLFGLPADKIEVLVHRQSIIHSMVEYQDGSVLAQMGASDMCTPITNAFGYPQRLKTPGQRLDFTKISELNFEAVDLKRFPAVQLAYDCLKEGDTACIAMNAANEIAVQAFLDHKIAFLDIYKLVSQSVRQRPDSDIQNLDDVISYDNIVRKQAESYIVSDKLKQA